MKKAFFIAFIAIILSPVIGFIYVTEFEKKEIEHVSFGDTGYELTISQIGDPDWPFGATHCQFDFKDGKETVSTLNFDIHNDGGSARSGNFHVHWFAEFVRVVVTAEEQPETLYDLYFDGNIETAVANPARKTDEERAAEAAEAAEAAREKVAKILYMDLPQDSEVSYNENTYKSYRPGGDAFIMLRIGNDSVLLEQIREKGTWNPLPLPEDLWKIVERTRKRFGTDEEIGDGYWFFLDRHEKAVDRTDCRAALEREELHYILAFYSTSSLAAKKLTFYQVDAYGGNES